MIRSSRSLSVVLPTVILSAMCVGWANVRVLFKEAAKEASAIVLARPAESTAETVTFTVLETVRGNAPEHGISVRRDLWEYRRPRIREADLREAFYLLLLNSDRTLLCGHISGLLIAGDSCEGILPVLNGVLRKEYREPYDGTDQRDITLIDLKIQLERELATQRK